jgi:hypothetical protein
VRNRATPDAYSALYTASCDINLRIERVKPVFVSFLIAIKGPIATSGHYVSQCFCIEANAAAA